MGEHYTTGTFGHLVYDLGLTFEDLSAASGIDHTTLGRWAKACQNGARLTVRVAIEQAGRVFDLINTRDKQRGGEGLYGPRTFGFSWAGQVQQEALVADVSVQAQIEVINRRLQAAGTPKLQLEEFSAIGRGVRSGVERVAFDIAWRRFCAGCFPNMRDAHKTPPRGCDWYEA